MNFKTWRKGSTAKEWSDDPSEVKVSKRRIYKAFEVALDFWMPSKGGGITDVRLYLAEGALDEILKAADDDVVIRAAARRLKAFPDVTLKACGDILAAHPKAAAQVSSSSSVVGFQTRQSGEAA